MAYDLSRLGYLQFQQLCTELLALERTVDPAHWSGDADGWRTAPAGDEDGVLVVCVWRRDLAEHRLGELLARHFGTVSAATRVRVLLPRSCPAELADRLQQRFECPFELLDAAALSRRIDAAPELRRRCPSVLGLRELTPLIDAAVESRSGFDRAAASALARVFVATGAYARTREVLAQHRFAVLTGPPEMGKTAIARVLGLAQLTDGWEVHECTRPEQLFTAYDAARAQLFVADDAFGSTEYRADAAEGWAREIEQILRRLDDRHWLIWTSRPAPLRAGLERIHRERGAERFPSPGEVLVDAGALALEEKALILLRHAKASELPAVTRQTLRSSGPVIVAHPHFTPERIRRLVAVLGRGRSDELSVARLAERELARSSEAMETSLRALGREHRALLIAMLDTPPGPVGERELTAAMRRHHPTGLSRPPAELIDRLTDHFLRVEGRRIAWVHPSWRDLVIVQLRADGPARRAFLGACSAAGAQLALSGAGGAAGERELPLLVDDADWDALAGRAHELEPDALLTVIAAVREAVQRGATTSTERAELASLGRGMLERVSAIWHRERTVVAAGALETWLGLARLLVDPPPLPPLGHTWIELVPTGVPDLGDRAAVERLVEWLELVVVLQQAPPEAAATLPADAAALEYAAEFLQRLNRSSERGQWIRATELGRRLLRAGRIISGEQARAELGDFDRSLPRELPAELGEAPLAAHPEVIGTSAVRRVLNDL